MSEKKSRRKSSKAALMLGTSLVGSIGAAASSSASATGPSFSRYPSFDLRNALNNVNNGPVDNKNLTNTIGDTIGNSSNTSSAGIWSWIKDSASSFGGKLKDKANYIDNATGNRISAGANAIGSGIKKGVKYTGETLKSLYNSADNYFEGGISSNAEKLWEKTKDFGGAVAEKANKLESVLAKGTDAAGNVAKKAFNYVDGKWGNKVSSLAKENLEKLKNSEFVKEVSGWGNKIAESDTYKKVAPYTVDLVKNHYRTIGLIISGYITYKLYKSYKNKNEEKKEENKNNNNGKYVSKKGRIARRKRQNNKKMNENNY